MIDTAPASEATLVRAGMPRHVHDENPNAPRGFAKLIDYTVDVSGSDYVATFGDGQGALSGRTLYLRTQAAAKNMACLGTVPTGFLPANCRSDGSQPVVSPTRP